MAVGEPHRTLWPIYQVPIFWGALLVTCMCTFGINYGIDYAMHQDNVNVAVINGSNFAIGVLATVVVIDLIVFFGAGGMRDRIIAGKQRPVAQVALCDTLLKRILFFSLAEPVWQTRLPRFIAQTMLFPGLFVLLGVYMICWFVSGCGSLPQNACEQPLHVWCAWTALWKVVIASSVYTMNFAAVHNDAQPELQSAMSAPLMNGEGGAYKEDPTVLRNSTGAPPNYYRAAPEV